jgi:hypothetical protein
MSDKQFHFWQTWLTYANVMTILVGLMIAFSGNSFIFSAYNTSLKTVFFHSSDLSPEILQFKNWFFGVIGGTIVGFHILMLMVSEFAFKRKEPWAYVALCLSLLSWFLIDSSISIYYGALFNVVLINLVALILIGIPLWMTRKVFLSTRNNTD